MKIAPKPTYYYCDFFEIPKIEKKAQMIQFEMHVNENNKRLVHHLAAFACSDNFVPSSLSGRECGSVYLPNDIANNCQQSVFFAWGVGGPKVLV